MRTTIYLSPQARLAARGLIQENKLSRWVCEQLIMHYKPPASAEDLRREERAIAVRLEQIEQFKQLQAKSENMILRLAQNCAYHIKRGRSLDYALQHEDITLKDETLAVLDIVEIKARVNKIYADNPEMIEKGDEE